MLPASDLPPQMHTGLEKDQLPRFGLNYQQGTPGKQPMVPPAHKRDLSVRTIDDLPDENDWKPNATRPPASIPSWRAPLEARSNIVQGPPPVPQVGYAAV